MEGDHDHQLRIPVAEPLGVRAQHGGLRARAHLGAQRLGRRAVELEGDDAALENRIRDKLPNPPVTAADQAAHAKYQALEKRYHDLAAGLYADAKPAQTEIGVAPVVVGVVVGGVVIGVAGIAWSIAAYEYAVNLREQTALAERELDARVEASREGRTLQPSTVPPQDTGGGVGWLLVGGLALAAGAVAVPYFIKKRG